MKLTKGDRVWIERVKDHGVIQSLSRDGRRAVVGVGGVKLDVQAASLGDPLKIRPQGESRPVALPRRRQGKRVPCELDMHGLRVEDALPRLDEFIDAALRDGLAEIRIIHGHGSGVIRKVVHQHLKTLGIRHFRLGENGQTPGGDGVTIVSL